MGLQRFPLSDLSGGMNTVDAPMGLEPNECSEQRNLHIIGVNRLKQRLAAAALAADLTGGVTAESVGNIKCWYPGTSNWIFFSIDPVGSNVHQLWCMNGTTKAVTQISAGAAGDDIPWCLEAAKDLGGTDRLWAINKVTRLRITDGAPPTAIAWAGLPVATLTMCRSWKERMIVSGDPAFPSRLYFSAKGDPNTFPANNIIDIGSSEDDFDGVTWLDVIGDYILPFKRNSVWAVTDPVTFANRRIGSPGCEDRFQSDVVKGRCFFFSLRGGVGSEEGGSIWSTDGLRAPRHESRRVDDRLFGPNFDRANSDRVRVCTHNERIFVSRSNGAASGTEFDRVQVWEFVPRGAFQEVKSSANDGSWVIHTSLLGPITSWRDPTTDEYKFVGGKALDWSSVAANRLKTLYAWTNNSSGEDWSSIACRPVWISRWVSFISEEMRERLRRLNIFCLASSAGHVVSVSIYRDFEEITSAFSGNFAPPEAGIVTDERTLRTGLRRVRPELRGRYFQISISPASSMAGFELHKIEAAIRGGKEH